MRSTLIPLAIILGGVIVATAVYFSIAYIPSTSSSRGSPALVRPVGADDHILGNPTASVMVIEYADFDCDYCKDFEDIMQQIIANEGVRGQIAWVYRHFPLTELHPNAFKHARAAECVATTAGNDAFWKFADALFKNQPTDPARYGELAASAGASAETFTTCYTNAATTVDARIRADRQNALDAGASGTPYSLILIKDIPPVVVDGAYSYDALKLLIDEALQDVSSINFNR